MNTTPEEFQQRLKESRKRSRLMLLFALLQVGMLLAFTVLGRLLGFAYWSGLVLLVLLAALAVNNYVQHLRFMKVYSRCVALIVRFEATPPMQVNLRGCLQEQLDAEVDKLCAVTGSARHDSTLDANTPD